MSGQIIADLTERSSTPKAVVGQFHIDNLGRYWQYVKASAAIAQYEYVKVSTDSNYTISSMTTTTNPSTEPASVGCAQTAFASGDYGYVFRGHGYHIGKFAASCVQNVKIYTTATNGVVDDAATTLVAGLKLITTITGAADSPAFACGLLTTANA